ncbi:MAG: hypothetical protein K2N51_16610 [Lachnospiraceae bacterium]|nr:hypothetical protein [Lachnospiraceae bacterium]
MTENEAIEYLKGLKEDYFQPEKISNAFNVATDALKEIQKYRELGTIEFLTDMKSNYVEVLSDLRQYQKVGTVEELKEDKAIADELSAIEAAKYYAVISEWKKYQEIGTIEECREARKMIRRHCEPKYLGENIGIGCREGMCECGNIVKSYQKFCDECGIKLDWGNVTAWQQLPEPYKEGE